jgi:drug/metabolite transporter (DMT)-like permease
MLNLKLVVMILVPIIIGVLGQLFLKIGMQQVGEFTMFQKGIILQYLKIFLNPYVFIGLCFYFLSTVFYLYLISRVPLSFAYPMLSLSYVIVGLISWIFFKEQILAINWVGMGVILVGVALVAQGRL